MKQLRGQHVAIHLHHDWQCYPTLKLMSTCLCTSGWVHLKKCPGRHFWTVDFHIYVAIHPHHYQVWRHVEIHMCQAFYMYMLLNKWTVDIEMSWWKSMDNRNVTNSPTHSEFFPSNGIFVNDRRNNWVSNCTTKDMLKYTWVRFCTCHWRNEPHI